MGLYAVLAVFMNREFLGKDLMGLLDSYEVKTAAILLLTGLMLTWRSWAPLHGQHGHAPLHYRASKGQNNKEG